MLRLFDAIGGDTSAELEAGVFPPVNITQDDDHYYVRAEVPGINVKDIQISAMGRRLSLTGRREIASESNAASYHRKERAEGQFSRTVTLPAEFDINSVDARYKSGILTVTLPKSEAAKPRQIVVSA
jgi:HSP20 family protein